MVCISKIIKAVRLQRRLRVQQEFYCYKVVKWTWNVPLPEGSSPHLPMLSSLNRAVGHVNAKLPWIYFALSDILGAKSLRREIRKTINDEEYIRQTWSDT